MASQHVICSLRGEKMHVPDVPLEIVTLIVKARLSLSKWCLTSRPPEARNPAYRRVPGSRRRGRVAREKDSPNGNSGGRWSRRRYRWAARWPGGTPARHDPASRDVWLCFLVGLKSLFERDLGIGGQLDCRREEALEAFQRCAQAGHMLQVAWRRLAVTLGERTQPVE